MKNVFLYHGEDDYLVTEAAKRLLAELLTPEEREYGLEVIDGRAAVIDEAVAAINACCETLQTAGLFGGKKVVWLRDATFVTGGAVARVAESERTKTRLQQLTALIKDGGIPEEYTLVVTAPKVLKGSVFFKACAAAGETEDFSLGQKPYEKERAVRERLPEFLKGVGLKMTGSVQTAFLGKVGFDTRTIMSELEKLRSYCAPNDSVALKDVEAITSVAGESELWDVADAVAERAPQKLLQVLEGLSGQKNIGIPVATMVINRIQDLLLLNEALTKKWITPGGMWQTADSDVQTSLAICGLRGGQEWKLRKLLQQVKNFTGAELAWARFYAMEMRERLVSTGGGDEQDIIQMHLLRITTRAK